MNENHSTQSPPLDARTLQAAIDLLIKIGNANKLVAESEPDDEVVQAGMLGFAAAIETVQFQLSATLGRMADES